MRSDRVVPGRGEPRRGPPRARSVQRAAVVRAEGAPVGVVAAPRRRCARAGELALLATRRPVVGGDPAARSELDVLERERDLQGRRVTVLVDRLPSRDRGALELDRQIHGLLARAVSAVDSSSFTFLSTSLVTSAWNSCGGEGTGLAAEDQRFVRPLPRGLTCRDITGSDHRVRELGHPDPAAGCAVVASELSLPRSLDRGDRG